MRLSLQADLLGVLASGLLLDLGFLPLFATNVSTETTHSCVLHRVLHLLVLPHLVGLVLRAISHIVVCAYSTLGALSFELFATLGFHTDGSAICVSSLCGILCIEQNLVGQIRQVFLQETIVIGSETRLRNAR